MNDKQLLSNVFREIFGFPRRREMQSGVDIKVERAENSAIDSACADREPPECAQPQRIDRPRSHQRETGLPSAAPLARGASAKKKRAKANKAG